MTWPTPHLLRPRGAASPRSCSRSSSSRSCSLSGHSPVDAFKSMWQYIDSADSVVSIINRAGAVLRVGARRRHRVQDEPVQHRRRRPVPAGGAARRRRRRGRHAARAAPRDFIILVAMAVGAAWAAIAGVLKVWRGVNEVVSTIMLNSIATGITAYLLAEYLRAKNEPATSSRRRSCCRRRSFIPPLNRFLELFGFHLPSNTQLNGFLVGAVLLGVGFYVLVWRTRFGFDLRATGRQPGGGAGVAASTPRR